MGAAWANMSGRDGSAVARGLLASLVVLGAAAAGCGRSDPCPGTSCEAAPTVVPDDEMLPERPIALLLLIDRSSSLGEAMATCTTTPCPTRLPVLKAGLARFLGSAELKDTLVGALPFPSTEGACEVWPGDALGRVGVPVSAGGAAQAKTLVSALTAGGESPTAAAVAALTEARSLYTTGRATFVVLVTDGAPNCNAANPNDTCMTVNNACRCTLGNDLRACLEPPRPDGFDPCSQGCSDAASAVDALRTLRGRGVESFVLALGPRERDAEGLEVMAQAGGGWAKCQNGKDSACGPAGRCDGSTGRCANGFYWARSEDDLVRALQIARRRAATSR